mmetsp:Transcript_94909/g.268274  ORF Transcript_94909/g.268274 Transcript_94909/m.268274 type:complete len:312 (-) Transcript_94909:53-988(-)
MVLMHLCRLQPPGVVPALLSILVIVAMVAYVSAEEKGLFLECIAYSCFISGTHVIVTLGDPRWVLSDHRVICDEHQRVVELLDRMLPREVLAEMRSGVLTLGYYYEDITFLFADIVGFTRFCAEHTAEQAVNLVTRLFAEFDEQVVKLGIYKVCTIGDAYVVVNEPRLQLTDKYTDCACVFSMAAWMLQAIVRVRDEVQHQGLDMRIGLHFGRFVGGVIGTKRMRFDIWGEDVLIGNNVESHGKAGQICISEAARDVLERAGVGALTFAPNDDLVFKNGRAVKTYLCTPAGGCDTYPGDFDARGAGWYVAE